MTEHPPRRVRVTVESPAALVQTTLNRTSTRGIALPGSPADDADAVFARALRRSQLRLALGIVAGFVVITAVLTLVIALIPELNRLAIAGLPLPWMLHAFAFYPVIIVFALLYQRGARRNERAYRALKERG